MKFRNPKPTRDDRGRLELGAAAGSSPLLEPPFCTRPALAVVVPTRCSSLQLVYVHVFMLHNFQLNQHLWLAQWRQTSTWKSCARHAPPVASAHLRRINACMGGAASIFQQLAELLPRAYMLFQREPGRQCMRMQRWKKLQQVAGKCLLHHPCKR